MIVELFYISGLNNIDTLYFDNIDEQNNYFYNATSKVSLNDFSFYPPHYTNKILLSTADIDFNSNVNYLRLQYNNKWYYYFIENIDYISEETVSIDVVMDVIQTYLFNIKFNYVDIERRLIDRWYKKGMNFEINRNYIRENLSNSSFYYGYYKRFNYDFAQYDFILVDMVASDDVLNINTQFTKALNPTVFKYFNNKEGDYKTFTDGYYHYYLIIPTRLDKNYIIKQGSYGINTTNAQINPSTADVSMNSTQLMTVLEFYSSHPSIISLNIVPYNMFSDTSIRCTSDDNNTYIQLEDNLAFINQRIRIEDTNDIGILYLCPKCNLNYTYETTTSYYEPVELNRKNYSFSLDDTKIPININKLTKIPFSINFIPQMLDENYRQLEFGERISYTTVPYNMIYKYSINIKLEQVFITNNGNRAYCTYINNDLQDIYINTLIVPTTESFAIKNDAWKTYVSQNQATLSTGLAYQFFTDITDTGLSAYKFNKPTNMYDRRYKVPTLTKAGKNYSKGIIGTALNGVKNIMGTAVDYQVNKDNLQNTPKTITQGNNVVDNIVINSNDVMVREKYVYDYDKVCEQLEENGYKVNEHYSNINIIKELNTRYYYNYFQCSALNISLDNVLNDNDTLQLIIDRFNDGLRFWNIQNCNNDGIDIGQLFVYDNVEKSLI